MATDGSEVRRRDTVRRESRKYIAEDRRTRKDQYNPPHCIRTSFNNARNPLSIPAKSLCLHVALIMREPSHMEKYLCGWQKCRSIERKCMLGRQWVRPSLYVPSPISVYVNIFRAYGKSCRSRLMLSSAIPSIFVYQSITKDDKCM
jgi:hypothetical protein